MSEETRKDRKGNILPAQDISFFCAQIGQLLSAGIPLSEGFDVMLTDADNPKERALLEQMRDGLEDREPLSKVLAGSGLFPPYVLRMTEVGEATGQLDRIMNDLSHYYEKEAEIKKALRSAAAYPLVMVVIMLVVLLLLAFTVMPVFEGVFAQLGAAFTPATQAVIRWIGGISAAGLGLVALAAAAAAVLRLSSPGKATARLKARLLGRQKLFVALGSCRYAEILAMSLHSGMDVDQGSDMALSLVDNQTVEEKIRLLRAETEKGKSFPDAVKTAGLFTALQRQMIQVGMRAGTLDETMARIASECEDAVDDRIARSMGRLEPILTTALSLVAGGILVLVMFPLLGVLSSIG